MSKRLPDWQNNLDNIILIDNGSYEIKYSTANPKTSNNKIHNAKFVEKTFNFENKYFIDDIDKNINLISNFKNNFQRPLKRGLLYNIDVQIDIWDEVFKKMGKAEKNKDNLFMFTHPPHCPEKILESYLEVIFEYFGFDACIKSIPHLFTSIFAKKQFPQLNDTVQLVVDSGFSSTTVVPIFSNRPVLNSIKRVDISGKLLTNFLKESLNSIIDLDFRKDFFLVNLIKEELCFISDDFLEDMRISKLKTDENSIKKPFILPEYRNKGEEVLKKIAKEKYSIDISNLRFIIPELIFNPNLIGIEEGGLQEAISQSISSCHTDYNNLLTQNIIISGGNTNFKNFGKKLKKELIPYTELNNPIRIHDIEGKDNKCYNVIKGMKTFSQDIDVIKNFAMTKSDYDELGTNVIWKQYL